MIHALYWASSDNSPRLTTEEVDKLFSTCQQLASLGVLNGKFQNACVPLFWVRTNKEN